MKTNPLFKGDTDALHRMLMLDVLGAVPSKPKISLLARLTRMNYRFRELGLLPDRWHWADRMLLDAGYYINGDGELKAAA